MKLLSSIRAWKEALICSRLSYIYQLMTYASSQGCLHHEFWQWPPARALVLAQHHHWSLLHHEHNFCPAVASGDCLFFLKIPQRCCVFPQHCKEKTTAFRPWDLLAFLLCALWERLQAIVFRLKLFLGLAWPASTIYHYSWVPLKANTHALASRKVVHFSKE